MVLTAGVADVIAFVDVFLLESQTKVGCVPRYLLVNGVLVQLLYMPVGRLDPGRVKIKI